MNTKSIIRGAALVAILGIAPGAMAKSMSALLWAQNYGQGSTFSTCNGASTVWGQASGYDSSGNLMCLVRQFNNSLWVTTSVCPASATQHNASLRSVGNSFCASPKSAWGSLQSCSVNNLFLRPNGGACVNAGTVHAMSSTGN